MKVIRETAIAGKTICRTVKVPSGRHTDRRKKRGVRTPEAVQKNNDRLAVRNLTLLLNENFDENGAHITLTYQTARDREQAKRDRKTFIKKLRRAMKERGLEAKYVIVTEYEHKRIHHHVVVNTKDIALIDEVWTHGFARITPLDPDGNYHRLAEYLIKETTKTFRQEDSLHKHRYGSSRNLKRPEIRREIVDERELWKDPEAVDGYFIDADSLRRYEHPVTGLEHLEYIEVAINEARPPRKRGKVVTGREYFKPDYIDRQEELLL